MDCSSLYLAVVEVANLTVEAEVVTAGRADVVPSVVGFLAVPALSPVVGLFDI
jgi:hypothetical protein